MGDETHNNNVKPNQLELDENSFSAMVGKTVPVFTNADNLDQEGLVFSDSDDETKISLYINESGDEPHFTNTSTNSLEQSNEKQLNLVIDNINSHDIQKEKKNKIEHVDTKDDLKKGNKVKKFSIIDTDDSDIENIDKKNENLTEFSASSDDEQTENKSETKNRTVEIYKTKTFRKSAKVAMDTINAIKSETQRLHREIHIDVPYHKPKSCTLKEFMSRKTVLKPEIAIESNKRFSLKMNEEELINYATFLEKREEEVEKLFTNENFEEKAKEINHNKYVAITSKPIKDNSIGINNIDCGKIVSTIFDTTITEETINKNKVDEINRELSDNIVNYSEIESFSDELKPKRNNIEQNINEEVATPKVQIISNIQISPAIVKSNTETVKHLKQLINQEAKISNYRPKLSGSPTSIIDLESGDILPAQQKHVCPGLAKLIERFTNANFKKESSKVIGQNNEILVCKESNKEIRPGINFVKLKNNLMRKIKEQRKIEINNKIKHHKEEEEIATKIFEEEDDEIMCENLSEKSFTKDEQNSDEDMFNYAENDKNCENNYSNDLDLNEISDGEADDESDEQENLEIHKIKSQKNKRVIKMTDESSSENEESLNINFSLKYPLEITEVENPDLASLKTSINNNTIKNLCDTIDNTINEEEELFDLCSGKFEKTQPVHSESIYQFEKSSEVKQSQVDYLQNNAYKSSELIFNVNKDNVGQSSEDEISNRNQRPNRKNNITYSEDEHSHDDNSDVEEIDDEKSEKPTATFIDYDSDENEIQIAMTKNDITKKVNEYFEQEAELSESDWSSADEDEKNLDKYDIELGDEDEFDQQKLKDELDRIHMRKLLDDDARQVKKMQQLFLEDEENDGIGRQRQFRWKKTENDFNLDDTNSEQPNDLVLLDSNDEDDEEIWRKMKHDREIILKNKLESDVLLPLQIDMENILENSASRNLMSKVKTSNAKTKLNESENKIDSPFLISKSSIKSIRGSFLKRDGDILTKVASITTHSSDFNGIATVQSHTGKTKNFTFSVLSQKPDENNKRKLSPKKETYLNKKKIKIESNNDLQRKKSLIDHLNDL